MTNLDTILIDEKLSQGPSEFLNLCIKNHKKGGNITING